ncbi:uncharacterized protein LOC131682876 isoform X3 [Topomyia yanbarensis]|uniref:uncharacterized protein LOC131682876 isoform X3 n=1 Tax=Topomyia yanbarensis TaxID=2498891 RepID=UPI00273C1195|nr:uncharacterized protein LOC131682876 isoform X3 [Topomyia yanbarensis]
MYHGNFNVIYEHTIADCNQTKFSDKVYNIMESYLPLLQYNGNIFQNVSSLKIPKSASTLYLESTQILQSFQQAKGVLGGAILYHNKVVASQLSDSLTKIFTVSDLYRTKSSEHIAANYHIPIGVTLINAYIPTADYNDLVRKSNQSFNLFAVTTTKDTIPFQQRKKSFSRDAHSMMKRDKSLIFTNIPEEDTDDGSELFKPVNQNKNNFSRPTHLPLIFKNQTSLEATEPGFNSINFDESDSFPNFIGKTSVCSTPMTENKLLPHGNVLSICALSEDIDATDKPTFTMDQVYKEYIGLTEAESNSLSVENKTNVELVNYFTNSISNPYNSGWTRASFPNINDLIDTTEDDGCESSENIGKGKAIPRLRNLRHVEFCKTLADPSYPIFNANGILMSISLFKEFLELHYNELQKSVKAAPLSTVRCSVKVADHSKKSLKDEQNNDYTVIQNSRNTKKKRRELNLPLKSLNIDVKNTEVSQSSNIFDSPSRRKKLSGLQLTPLMSKLTLLAMNDQQSSGFSSWDTTPGGSYNNSLTPLDYQPKRRKSISFPFNAASKDDTSDGEVTKLTKVDLFICVQQNMTLVLILQERSCEKEEMIHSLFETCVSKLTRIENSLHQAMSINVEGCDKGDSGYSFICLDSKWDVNNRCGPWNPKDLLTLNSLHNNFHYNRKLVELTLRLRFHGWLCSIQWWK